MENGERGAGDEVINHYHALSPSTFSHLAQFILTQPKDSGVETNLRLTFTHQDPAMPSEAALILNFCGIQELAFTLGNVTPIWLDILSIRERGWLDLNYRVCDEEDTLSFYCRDFTARLRGNEE